MTGSARALFVVLTSWSAACDTHSTGSSPFSPAPTAPTATPAPPPPRLGGERWTLTTTLTAVTGGDACGLTFTPGRSGRWLLFLSRLADSRATVVIADQQNANARHEYAGTLSGDELAVTDGGHLDAMQCNGTYVAMDIESRVSGIIVDDGHALVGEEVATARLASGQTLTWLYEWRATFP